MRIVFTGGGTGGHIFPIIAIAREIRGVAPDADLRFIGPVPFGGDLLAREGILVRPIRAGKLPRYPTPRIFLEALKFPVGLFRAFWELYWFMPDVVFGKGGYGMIPVVFVAWIFRIPVVIHESDAVAGLATRAALPLAREILLSFPVTKGVPAPRARIVGNPVRENVCRGDRHRAQERFRLALKNVVLVLGGSQGAEEINQLMIEIAPKLVPDTEVIHQAGVKHADRFAREVALALEPYPDAFRFYHVVPFLDEGALADAYAAASVVVSRAGAGAIFELAIVGAPSIFIPLRGAAGDHQRKNAAILERLGAAKTMSGPNLTPHLLLAEIRSLLTDEKMRQALSQHFLALAKPNAAAEIAQIIMQHGS